MISIFHMIPKSRNLTLWDLQGSYLAGSECSFQYTKAYRCTSLDRVLRNTIMKGRLDFSFTILIWIFLFNRAQNFFATRKQNGKVHFNAKFFFGKCDRKPDGYYFLLTKEPRSFLILSGPSQLRVNDKKAFMSFFFVLWPSFWPKQTNKQTRIWPKMVTKGDETKNNGT